MPTTNTPHPSTNPILQTWIRCTEDQQVAALRRLLQAAVRPPDPNLDPEESQDALVSDLLSLWRDLRCADRTTLPRTSAEKLANLLVVFGGSLGRQL